jgi:PPP family 3-phenylpropionic acid transporter
VTLGAAKDRVFRFASIYLLFFAALGAFIPWMPVYLRERGFGASWIGLALALGALMRIVAAPALGRALDRSPDPRRPLFGFALLAVVSMLVAAWADSAVARFVALAVHALVAVPVMPYTEATIQIALADRPDRYGPIRLWGSLGFIATALSTSLLPAWSAPWIVAGCWAGLALLLRWLPRHPQVVTHADRVAWPAALRPLLIAAALATAAHGPYYQRATLVRQSAVGLDAVVGAGWFVCPLVVDGGDAGTFRVACRANGSRTQLRPVAPGCGAVGCRTLARERKDKWSGLADFSIRRVRQRDRLGLGRTTCRLGSA